MLYKNSLLRLSTTISHHWLLGKCIFLDETGSRTDNRFLEITSTQTKFAASATVLVGGRQKRVTKIMLYKRQWLQTYYLDPMERLRGMLYSCHLFG